MTRTDDLLRETFAAEATTVTMHPDARAKVDVVAQRHHARRTVTIGAGVLAAAGLALAVPAIVQDPGTTGVSSPPAAAVAAPYESWAPRGRLGGDPRFAGAAAAAWDAASPGAPAHSDIRVLWADTLATGRGAVLVGTDGTGGRRLAVVAGATPSLAVVRDIPAPESLTHLSFNLFTDDEQHSEASYQDTLVLVTPPGSGWTLEWSGGADPSYGAGVSATTDGIAVVDISQSGPWGNPSIRVRDAAQVLYAGPIGSQS